MMERSVYDPQRLINSMLLLLVLMAVPTLAHAAGTGGIFDFIGSGSIGCTGASSGQSCSMDEKKLFTSIACKVMKTVDTAIIPIFCNIINNPSYRMFLDGAMTLYVVIYGVNFVSGITPVKLGVIVIAIIKATLIYALMTNADFFFSFVYSTILQTPQELVKSLLSAHGSGAQSIFEHVDEGMYKIFEEITQPQLDPEDRQTYMAKEMTIVAFAIGLKHLMPGGNSIYGLFMFVVMGWMMSYLSIIVRYLLSYMALVFLLMLSPIFIPSLLFKPTREALFNEWAKMMFSFMIELVVVVAFILMIEKFYLEFYDMLKKSFGSGGGGGGSAVGAGGGGGGGLQLTEGDTRYIRTYNAGIDEDYVKEETVRGLKDPVKDLNKAGYTGDATQISAQAMIDLVTMAVIVFLSSIFLRYIPQFAGMLAGQFNYNKMFGGVPFSQKGSSANRVNLYGQHGGEGRASSVTPDADRSGGIWGDFARPD